MELERANKEWLTFIQKWLNTLKKKHVLSLNVLQQFEDKSPLLETHLKAISSWLKNNGIKEATKCLPTVGKLLAGLSKICLVLAKDDLSSSLLDCFFHLSGLWHENEAGNKHPKIWAMEHFDIQLMI
ncbi:uncharacterized protein [Clytia hemisphaerica]|uniref:uncharacterized protein n=1 Tax=Clytia hemisphaerica TaxID=252671 RepID=UPI0034D5332B